MTELFFDPSIFDHDKEQNRLRQKHKSLIKKERNRKRHQQKKKFKYKK